MDELPTPMDPDVAGRRYAAMLDEAGLPHFSTTFHDPEIHELELTWDHGLTIHIDLTRAMSPLEDWERVSILGHPLGCCDHEPIDVYVPGSAEDPRTIDTIPGVVIHHGPPLHPDDVTTIDGIPVTSLVPHADRHG